ncbi:MAG: hypothetical protein SPLUMA2_SPLUMAMAG2_00110 [uncultured Sulfurimonas sp.]|nr:MAG: hypothetical protein SPLUMA2_SPLUMAMAG2_00110 [uncultured Sulfurimonas sp.]
MDIVLTNALHHQTFLFQDDADLVLYSLKLSLRQTNPDFTSCLKVSSLLRHYAESKEYYFKSTELEPSKYNDGLFKAIGEVL